MRFLVRKERGWIGLGRRGSRGDSGGTERVVEARENQIHYT